MFRSWAARCCRARETVSPGPIRGYHPRAVRKKILLLFASLLVALILAEVVLRTAFAGYATQIYTLDETLLHRLIPGTVKVFTHHPNNGGHRVTLRVNSAGYRGEELLPRDEGRLRVAVFGDSCVMGEFSALEDTFCEQLERRLTAALNQPVEVVNAGVVAYGPDQTLRKMQRELPSLQPDLSLVVFFPDNDFGDLMRNKMFRLSEDRQALAPHDFVISEELRAKFGEGLTSLALYRWARRAYRNHRDRQSSVSFDQASPDFQLSAATQQVEKWIKPCTWEYEEFIRDGNGTVRFLFEDHFDADIAVLPESESSRYKADLFRAVAAEMQAVHQARGVPLAGLVCPSPFSLCGPAHGGHVDRSQHPEFDPKAMSELTRAAAADADFPCLNLFDAFSAAGADDLYLKAPDNHWNDAGQKVAAEQSVAFLLEQGVVEAKPR